MQALVFDPKIWGGKDKGKNEHCWKLGTIVKRYKDERGRKLVDVEFHHDGRISCGHFEDQIRYF